MESLLMKRKSIVLALALTAALPFAAHASDLSYTWIEGDYLDAGDDADGFGLRGSLKFGESGLYGLAEYIDLDVDTAFGEVGGQGWEAGLGYAHGLGERTDLISELAYSDFESVDGYRASVGVRTGLNDNLEGLFKANYRDIDCGGCDSDVTGTAGLQYKFTPALGVVGEVEVGDGDAAYLLGLRASF